MSQVVESLRLFSHEPVKLTEHILGDRLQRLIAAYERGMVLESSQKTGQSDPKKQKHTQPQSNTLSQDLKTRAFPPRGGDFVKDKDTGVWSRERIYTLPRSRGDCRFYNDGLLSMSRIEREWLTPNTSHLDVVNCYYSVLATLIDRLYPDEGPRFYPRIYQYADNREAFFDAMQQLVDPKLDWKTMFLSMISQKSAAGWMRDHGFPQIQLPTMVNELEMQLDKLRQFVVQSDVGKSFLGFGHGDLDAWEATNKIMTRLLSAIQTEQMLILIRCLEQMGNPASMWIHDAVEIPGLEPNDEGDQSRFLSLLRPRLDDAQFSPHLHLKFKSKSQTERLVAEAIKPYETDVTKTSEWLEYGYDQLKEMVESRDWRNRGYGLTKILSGGYIVCRPQGNDSDDPKPTLITVQEVTELCRHFPKVENPDNEKKTMPFIERWLSDPNLQCKSSTDCVFRDTICEPSVYNLYEGMDAERWEPLTGEERQDPGLKKLCDNFIDHLGDLVDDDDHVRWALDFIAHMFQYPSTKPGVALVLHSAVQGVGKNIFVSVLSAMLGRKYAAETAKPAETIFGTFNDMLANKLLVCINETPVSQQHLIEIFKDHITSPTDVIRMMRREGVPSVSRVRYFITTNSENFTHISPNERRFQVSSARARTLLDGPKKEGLVDLLHNKRALRFLYEFLMDREIPDGAQHNFCTSRVKSRVYLNNQERHRSHYASFLMDFLDNYEPPSATSSAFIVPGPKSNPFSSSATSTSSSSLSSSNSGGGPTGTIFITNDAMYASYKAYAEVNGYANDNSRGIPLPNQAQFNTNLASEVEVTLNTMETSPFGVSYYKHTMAPYRNKRVWQIDCDVCRAKLEAKYPTILKR